MFLISKVFFAALVVGVVLMIAACGSASSPQDILPMSPVESQSEETSPDNQPEPTPTDLPTEIVEPLSPVSPIVPEEAPAMAPANQQAVQDVPGSEAAVAATIVHLTNQTGLSADQISVVSIEPTDWSDASLGCPQEGMMYAQVITPGYLIVLDAQGQQYEYHADQAGNVVLCNQ